MPGPYEVRAVGTKGLHSDWIAVTVQELSTEALRVDLVLNKINPSKINETHVDYVPSLRNSLGEIFNDYCEI